jgi:hypothetical protein
MEAQYSMVQGPRGGGSQEGGKHVRRALDCGGKRSATPLSEPRPRSESGVAAALCHRSPQNRLCWADWIHLIVAYCGVRRMEDHEIAAKRHKKRETDWFML